jgi:C-terminal processing protease CtpA/Prc
MSLEDTEEKRAALKAINQNALAGIGARIKVDETGFPKITETTILSAIASTGQVESGDYITGIVNEDGSTIYFKGRPVQQIVQYLRGQPGTEVRLLMERLMPEGSDEPYAFEVPLLRSIIVMQPPY